MAERWGEGGKGGLWEGRCGKRLGGRLVGEEVGGEVGCEVLGLVGVGAGEVAWRWIRGI